MTPSRFAPTFVTSRMTGAALVQGLQMGLLWALLAYTHAAAAGDLANLPAASRAQAAGRLPQATKFLDEPASDDTRQVATWAIVSGDNRGLPFVVVDKVNAKVFVFDDRGQLRGASSALLGLARGDQSIPGIGERKMSSIRPEERTTPAGRFIASLGHDTANQDILWVDYANAISLHRVITSNPKENRLWRLTMGSPFDRRISYGCINVPVRFYEKVVIPTFTGTRGIVYILPEMTSIHKIFLGLPN